MKFKILVLLASISLSACTSLDIVKSEPIVEEQRYARYDSDSKMRYNAYNSDTHLKLILSTNDKTSFAKILNGGLTVYVNDAGKKKSKTFVTYPSESQPNPKEMNFENEQRGSRPPDLKILINKVPNIKIYSFQGKAQRLSLHEGDIKIKLYAQGAELFYELLIPFDRISSISKTELREINVGIESGTLDMPEKEGVPPSGMQGGGRDGMFPGGAPGGGVAGGVGQQAGGGIRPNRETTSEPIDFWFKVILN